MQTIQFTKLKKLPIPKSLDEKLLVSIAQDHLQVIHVNVDEKTGSLFFDTAINPEWTYAHIAPITKFNIGDRVKYLDHSSIYVIASIDYENETCIMNHPFLNAVQHGKLKELTKPMY